MERLLLTFSQTDQEHDLKLGLQQLAYRLRDLGFPNFPVSTVELRDHTNVEVVTRSLPHIKGFSLASIEDDGYKKVLSNENEDLFTEYLLPYKIDQGVQWLKGNRGGGRGRKSELSKEFVQEVDSDIEEINAANIPPATPLKTGTKRKADGDADPSKAPKVPKKVPVKPKDPKVAKVAVPTGQAGDGDSPTLTFAWDPKAKGADYSYDDKGVHSNSLDDDQGNPYLLDADVQQCDDYLRGLYMQLTNSGHKGQFSKQVKAIRHTQLENARAIWIGQDEGNTDPKPMAMEWLAQPKPPKADKVKKPAKGKASSKGRRGRGRG